MNFSDYIEENRERLLIRREELRLEIVDIEAELKAMEAYELAKAKGPPKAPGRPHQGQNQPREFYPVDPIAETMSVPEAGRHFLGLSESASWVAWRRGDIPAYKAGRYRRVPVAEMKKRLEDRAGASRSRSREEEGYPGSLLPVRE